MPRCNVIGCGRTRRKDKNHSFFLEPKHSLIRKQWREFVGIKDLKCVRICSDHFELSSYRKKTPPRLLLCREAVPTIRTHPEEILTSDIQRQTSKENVKNIHQPLNYKVHHSNLNQEDEGLTISQPSVSNGIFECKICKLAFTSVKKLDNHTFWCKTKNKRDGDDYLNNNLKKEVVEIGNYENNQTIKTQQKKENIEEDPLKIKNTLEKFEIKKEINEEITIKKEKHDTDEFKTDTTKTDNDPKNFVEHRGFEQVTIKIEDTLKKFEIKKEINEEIIIKEEKPDTNDDIFECETCELTFDTEIQLIDHTSWCKENKSSIETANHIQNDCASINQSDKRPECIKSTRRVLCAVPDCESRSQKDVSIKFHKFPRAAANHLVTIPNSFGNLEKITLFEAWKRVLKIQNAKPYMKVCTRHFKKDDYILPNYTKKYLKKNAVPSCHLPQPAKSNTKIQVEIRRK